MVTYNEIKTTLADVLGVSINELGDDTPLLGGPIESMEYIGLLLTLETKYKITLSDEKLEGVQTISDLTRSIVEIINDEQNSVFQKT